MNPIVKVRCLRRRFFFAAIHTPADGRVAVALQRNAFCNALAPQGLTAGNSLRAVPGQFATHFPSYEWRPHGCAGIDRSTTYHGAGSTGLASKKSRGRNMKPTHSTGMDGQSSVRAM